VNLYSNDIISFLSNSMRLVAIFSLLSSRH